MPGRCQDWVGSGEWGGEGRAGEGRGGGFVNGLKIKSRPKTNKGKQ